jgi:hypothetical protein
MDHLGLSARLLHETEREAARHAQTRVRELDRVWELTRRLSAMSGVPQGPGRGQADLDRAAARIAA